MEIWMLYVVTCWIFWGGMVIGRSIGADAATADLKEQAIKAGVAYWDFDHETGERRLFWGKPPEQQEVQR